PPPPPTPSPCRGVGLVSSRPAAAAGLVLAPPDLRDPGHATSYGVGELIRAAVDRGARSLIVGVGGTATNDGGAGAAQALGYRLLDRDRDPLPEPAGGIHLLNVFAIDSSGVDRRLADVDLRVAVDVTNELLGEAGATAVYGPQKGVAGELGEMLEDALGRWARTVRHDLGVELTDLPGGGAGGGLAAGLIGAGGGGIESGAALVADAVGLDDAIEAADLVVTGEGSLDAQTTFGKTVAHVIERCAALDRPCLAVAGAASGRPEGVADLETLAGEGITGAEAMERAVELAADAAERLLRRVAAGGA
ncbi:MAG: glycerate kinase, partial [Chloroflexi bacterium]|nr:glycerate kinase [Chloroflexota bacterium]